MCNLTMIASMIAIINACSYRVPHDSISRSLLSPRRPLVCKQATIAVQHVVNDFTTKK